MNSVTLADVAAAAGVSVATASRALAGTRRVGPDVAARVRRAADHLGYAGNGVARALRRRRTDTVGMLVPSIQNPFFTALVDGVEAALHLSGKQLLLCDSRHDPAVEAAHLRTLVERNVDGIIVSPCDATASRDAVARAAALVPLVQLDRWADVPGTDWVGMDDHRALRIVLEHLAGTGVRTAAFLTSAPTNSSTVDRVRGFTDAAADLGIDVVSDGVVFGDFSVESGEAQAAVLLSRGDRPDAIVCADDLIAIGVLRACREHGVAVPDDLQVTGIDDILYGQYTSPTLTTLSQPTGRMAADALRLLADRGAAALRDDEPAPETTRLAHTPRLIVRESTGGHR